MKTLTQPAALVILAYRFEWAMELLAELAVQLFPIHEQTLDQKALLGLVQMFQMRWMV
jgi:hypothetical protein